jgi:hypothetical protein
LGGHAIFSTPRRHGDVYQKWHRSTASFWRWFWWNMVFILWSSTMWGPQ